MQKYFIVFRLAVQDLLEYKFDFFLHTAKYAFMIIMMALVWIAVQQEGQTTGFDTPQTVTYFFFAAILYSLSNFHPWFVEEDIRLGNLSKFLVKPVSATMYYFSLLASNAVIETTLKLVVFIPLLKILNIPLQFELPRIMLFAVFLPIIFVCSFFLITTISVLAFWITEAYALRWGASIIFRFLAGALVPLIYFPEHLQTFFFYLPFQHFIFTPIQIITNQMSLLTGVQALSILISWTIVIIAIRSFLWRKGLHQYEGTGI